MAKRNDFELIDTGKAKRQPSKRDVPSDASQMDRKELTCPRCQRQSLYDVSAQHSRHDLRCPKCKSAFNTRIVKVRAKRGRGNRKFNTREFSVRVIEASGAEDLIEFKNDRYEDFDLRSKDEAAFSYVGKRLTLIENLTIGRHMKLSQWRRGCSLAVLILLLIPVILWLILAGLDYMGVDVVPIIEAISEFTGIPMEE